MRNLPGYVNIAKVFYPVGLHGTILGDLLLTSAIALMLLLEHLLKPDVLATVGR